MRTALISLCVLVFASSAFAQFDYQKVVKKYMGNQLKNSECSLDKDFKDAQKWQIMTYPVSNFGLLTLYDKQPDGTFSHLEDMWRTLRYNDSEVPHDFNEWLTMDGYVAHGTGGSITITQDQDKKKFGLGFVFPKLLGVMGLNIGFNKDTTTVVDLTIEALTARCLRRPEANRFLNGAENEPKNNRKVDPTVMTDFSQGILAIVVGDVIAKNITITIKPDLTTTASIEDKIGPDVKNKIFGADTELKFNYERKQKGTYTFTIANPVVIARLIKKQPGGGTSGGGAKFFEDWTIVPANQLPSLPKP